MKITLKDITVNYIESGSTYGLPVVFIHGFPFNHEMWKPQIPVLTHNIRAIMYDLRGHGLSDVGDGQFTIEMFVDDLIAMLDYLNLEKVILCGLSMGGYIALRAAERNPDRIKGMILCDTKSEPDTNEAKIKRSSTIKTIKESGVKVFTDEFVKTIFWEKTFKNNPEVVDFIKDIINKNSPIGICGTLLALASRTDTTASLSSVKIPTCIIAGEHDKITPPSTAQSMHNAIPKSELHILQNAGHLSNLENPTEFNKILLSYLKEHW